MAAKKKNLTPRFQVWVDARTKFRLSHVHIQMAREIGLNPKKLGSIANHDQERWKLPLPQFIEKLYRKRFGRDRPEVEMTIEEMARKKRKQKHPKEQSPPPESVTETNEVDEDPF
ncbi:MAG: hypothetical protein EOP84_35350 [Verrucomicrobiaceae bacterium]|nr:MAG: hypothetical protein EOP84_35350 [Verrucomicrobiaceae bacterium]